MSILLSRIFSFRTFSSAGIALASVMLFAGAAFADDRAECVKAAGQEAINACSRLISAGGLGSNAAAVFYNRGTAYPQPGSDTALADFN